MCIIVFTLNFVSLNNNLNNKIEKLLITIMAFVIIFLNFNTLKVDHYKTLVNDYNNRFLSIENLIKSNQNKISIKRLNNIDKSLAKIIF